MKNAGVHVLSNVYIIINIQPQCSAKIEAKQLLCHKYLKLTSFSMPW